MYLFHINIFLSLPFTLSKTQLKNILGWGLTTTMTIKSNLIFISKGRLPSESFQRHLCNGLGKGGDLTYLQASPNHTGILGRNGPIPTWHVVNSREKLVFPKPLDGDWENVGFLQILLLTRFKANDINLYLSLLKSETQGHLWSFPVRVVDKVLKDLENGDKKPWKINSTSSTINTVSQIWEFIMLLYTYILLVILTIIP